MARALNLAGDLVLAYFSILNLLYIFLTVIAWRSVTHYMRTRVYAGADEAFASPLTPGISVLVPAFNEAGGIVESVGSLLRLRYPEFEVVVMNDGSTDSTLELLHNHFDLVPVQRARRTALVTRPVVGCYVSRRYPELTVIDKVNGGKADSLNVGVSVARYPYVCAIDADAVLEEEALLRVAKPILDDPEVVVATGGIVRIVNGCHVEHGRVTEVRLPRSRLATLQVVEYFRAFLVGRVGWSSMQSLLIISGAFGLFRRAAVEEVGGWWSETVGEDIELVLRLHRHLRQRGQEYRIAFTPDPVCWTEAPETLTSLSKQRRRWQRGLGETLWRHRSMLFNPRYGVMGLFALPYFLIFEFLGPVLELLAYLVVPLAGATGALSVIYVVAFVVVTVLVGMLLSVSALALEEFSFRRHPRSRDVARMLVFALLENLGYRQLNSVWRLMAFVDMLRRRKSWGEMPRRGLGPLPVDVRRAI